MEYGPNTDAVRVILARTWSLTPEEVARLGEAWKSYRRNAWDAQEGVWDAARVSREDFWGASVEAARDRWEQVRKAHDFAWEEWDSAWYAITDAVLATVVRDLITPKEFKALAHPWLSVMS